MTQEAIEKLTPQLLLKRFVVADGSRPAPQPWLPSGKDVQRYQLAALLAGIPCLLAAAYYFGWQMFAIAGTALAGAALVEFLFVAELIASSEQFTIRARKPFIGGTLTFAVLLTLFLPATTPLWMVFLGSAFGVLFAKEIFGGTGHNIFSPILVAKGFLMFSYTSKVAGYSFASLAMVNKVGDADVLQCADRTSAFFGQYILCTYQPYQVALVGAALGVVAMIIARPSNLITLLSVAIFAGGGAYYMANADLLPVGMTEGWHLLVSYGVPIAVAFIVCDPATTPSTILGKIGYGMVIGVTLVAMRCFSNYPEAIIGAVLMGNLFAPMLDALTRKKEACHEA